MRDIRVRAARVLTRDHGRGHWATVNTVRTLKKRAAEQRLWAVDEGESPIATFTLAESKIHFYRLSWFAHPEHPALYLTDMAVHPDYQRKGVGRWCMREIERIARGRAARAVRFDAYDAAAGAGPFYEKCGYTLVHRGSFRGTPLRYYEKTLRAG